MVKKSNFSVLLRLTALQCVCNKEKVKMISKLVNTVSGDCSIEFYQISHLPCHIDSLNELYFMNQ